MIELEGPVRSYPYLEMTQEVMEAFGVPVHQDQPNRFRISGKERYRSREYRIEGDASSASYFFLAAAICRGRVRVENLNPRTRQGDIGISDRPGESSGAGSSGETTGWRSGAAT